MCPNRLFLGLRKSGLSLSDESEDLGAVSLTVFVVVLEPVFIGAGVWGFIPLIHYAKGTSARGSASMGESSPAYSATAAVFSRWSYSEGVSCNCHSVAYQRS